MGYPELFGRMDIHVHSDPDYLPRLLTNKEVVQEALQYGLSGVVLKSHQQETVKFARSVYLRMGKWFVFGSYVINSGLRYSEMEFVKQMVREGARIIYLPTTKSTNHNKITGRNGGISLIHKGHLKPQMRDLLAFLSEMTRVTLATGHISKQELYEVLESAKQFRISTVLIVHPEYHIGYLSQDEQIAIRDAFPNVLFERTCYSVLLNDSNRIDTNNLAIDEDKLEKLIDNIGVVGPEFSVLSSDLGQPLNPSPH